jgi:uncharacterized membrane protein HdeD (DUF308 family)
MRSNAMTTRPAARSAPWWAVALTGFIVVIIGVLLIVSPRTTAKDLFLVLGILCIAGGMGALISLGFNRVMWGYKVFGGLAAILIGLALAGQPLFSAYLLAAVALWILGVGVLLGGFALVIGGLSYASWTSAARAKAGLMIGLGALCLIAGFGIVLGSAIGPLKAPWLFGIAIVAAGVGIVASALNMRQRV